MRLLLFSILFLSNTKASIYSQSTFLNLHFEDEKVETVLEHIKNQSEFSFLYRSDVLNDLTVKKVDLSNSTVEQFLDILKRQFNLEYFIIDKTVVIRENTLLAEVDVTGKVTDSQGNPLPGVNVIEKGTNSGSVTDLNGVYTIKTTTENPILVFSYIGYLSEEVEVGSQTTINVSLIEDIQSLEEVVVIGYGRMKKSDITGSLSSISTEELSSVSVSSVDQLMQGRAAGLQVTSSSGAPGASSSIKIRGVNSINSSSEPLYVIDGVPVAANSSGDISASGTANNTGFSILSTINPGDIQSIEVLKDASSTAIFGSRGANGVILITTKTGTSGKSQINFNANYGISSIKEHYNVLNDQDFITYFNEYAAIDGITPIPTDGSLALHNNNWMDEITQNGVIQNYQLSVNGGDDKTQYYISGSYYDEQGIIKESFLKRYSGRINLDHKALDWARIGTNMSYSRTEHALTEPDAIIKDALAFAPVIPITNPDGEVYYPSYEYLNNGQIYSFNPIGSIYGSDRENFNDRILMNSYVQIDLTKSLVFKSTLGVDLINSTDQEYVSTLTARGINTMGRASIEQKRTNSLVNINQLTYQKDFGLAHSFTGTLIQESTKAKTQTLVNAWDNFPTDALGFYGIGTATVKQGVANNIREWSMLSYATRLNYSYSSKYMATFTARRDGSSRFGEQNKWGFFPSGAVAWRLSEESFLKNQEIVSNLKLRASYGITGNTDIGLYNSIVTIGTGTYSSADNEIAIYFPQRIANEDLRWETTKQTNIGLDLGVFNNRVNLSVDYFDSYTDDLLLAVNIPTNTGYTSVLKNAGAIENKGAELSLDAVIVERSDLSWSLTSTFSRSINKIVDLGGEDHITVGGQNIEVGQPLQNQLGYISTGIFQNEEQILSSPSRSNDEPGVPIYKDINKDGQIDGSDMIVLGRGFPDFYYGLTSNLKYKGFDLFMYFSGVNGVTVFNQTKYELVNIAGTNTLQEYYDNRWTVDNPSEVYPRSKPQYENRSSQFLEDASFLRLKTLTLGYNIPVKKVKGISQARIYCTAQNLFTITDYSGFDPEVNSSGQSNVAPPVDQGSYPRPRTISFGINLGF